VWVRKETGGSSIRWHDGVEYHWPEDGAVIKVPDELGRDLLMIDGGEHTKAEPPKPAPKPAAKAEPAAEAGKAESKTES
jgi:hypothetical protein